jgi:hypothetical protein
LAYKDADGRHADFHSLRHTFVTTLVRSGVSPKAAQSLARHSTINLTMNVYTSLTVNDQASALASLPPIPAVAGRPAGRGSCGQPGVQNSTRGIATSLPVSGDAFFLPCGLGDNVTRILGAQHSDELRLCFLR